MKSKKSTDDKMRDAQYDLIYGPHAIAEMLKARRRKLISLYMTDPAPKAFDRIKRYLPARVPNTQYVSRAILDRMAGCSEHAGIVALVSRFSYAKQMFKPSTHSSILLLDGIQDVRNLGAILRSAYCTGIKGIVLCQRGGAVLTPATFKASAGLAEYLDIYVASTVNQAVALIKQAGYHLYMAVLDGGTNALKVEYKEPLCLVIGNEGSGIAKEVQTSGTRITLPQVSPDVSYNASVAAGILMFLVQHIRKS